MVDKKEKTWEEYLNVSKKSLIKRYAKAYNISRYSIEKIMRETGMSIEGAAEEALRRKDESTFYVGDKLFKSVRSASDSLSIDNRVINEVALVNGINRIEAIQLYSFIKNVEVDDQYLNVL